MTEKSSKRAVTPDDYFKLKYITEAKLSPDGKHVLYGVSSYNEEKDEDVINLWLLKLKSRERNQLTTGPNKDFNAHWSPDGQKIAFISTRVEPAQIFLIDITGGEAKQVTQVKASIGDGPVWSPDGAYLAFSTREQERRDPNLPYRLTRNIYRFDKLGYLDEAVSEIFLLHLNTGKIQKLTDDPHINSAPLWSPDGQEILFLASHDPHIFEIFSTLKTVDMHGNVREIVPREWGNVHKAAWVPDSKYIVFSGLQRTSAMGHKTDLWVVKRRGGEPVCRTAQLNGQVLGGFQGDMPARPEGPIHIAADGQKAILRVQHGGKLDLYEIALHGEESCSPILKSDATLMLLGADADQMLYLRSSWQDPSNLFLADISGKNSQPLTQLNLDTMQNWLQPEVERLHFKGADDVEIEGWLMKPTTGELPYPTVLYIHGGPTGAFGNVFSFDFQMLAGAGFAILFVNPQGSTGYGSPFGEALNLRWGEIDYIDQMAAIDHAVAKGLVDPDRLGVYGLSYGGYMTCWMVTQTDRFKAAVSENPVTDLTSDYGVADASVWMNLDALGGHPHEYPDRYVKASPVTFAHQCKTPTLMLQGEHDYRCPALNTEQFYTMLKVNGCVTEMVRFPKSSHAESIAGSPLIRRAQNEELLRWMGKYLSGDE